MPILVKWDDDRDVFVPARRIVGQLKKLYHDGQAIWLEQIQFRSMASHNHQFVEIHDRWESMPEYITSRFINEKHLRKYALIRTGWVKEMRHLPFTNREDAITGAVLARLIDSYALVTIDDCVVSFYVARSQRMSGPESMTNSEFQKSKTDVLAFLDALLGIATEESDQYAELESAQQEALVRIGKAHRDPSRIEYKGGSTSESESES